MSNPTRWGLMSAGKISSDFATCLRSSPNHKIVAVAARSIDSANKFASKFGISKAYGSYLELVKDADVDVVYISTISGFHLECGLLALENGKNVLLEKPFTMTAKGSEKLIELAKLKNVFLMEAIWSRFNPLYQLMMQKIKEGAIGEVQQVNTTFGSDLKSKNEKFSKKSLGGGCMLDIGVYALNVISLVYNNEEPIEVKAVGHVSTTGVEEDVAIALKYSNNRVATASSSMRIDYPNECVIAGSKGKIVIPKPFHCPTKIIINGETHELPLPPMEGSFNFVNSNFLIYEADHVRDCLLKGLTQSPDMPLRDTLTLRKTTDHVLRQIGVFFEEE